MEKNIGNLINDFKNKLNIELQIQDINVQTPGISSSLLFNIKNKYLYKIYSNISDYNNSKYFFDSYKDSCFFQHIIFEIEEESSLCLNYLCGELLYNNDGDYSYLINQIYDIVSNYKIYDGTYYKLFNNSYNNFVDYLRETINWNYVEGFDLKCLEKNFDILCKYNYPSYILHGDFGSHNFIICNNKIKVIDPCTKIGDKLYDFYCGILSDPIIFKNLKKEQILNYFEEYEMEYKEALFNICFVYRMLIAIKYHYYKNTEIYYQWLDEISR